MIQVFLGEEKLLKYKVNNIQKINKVNLVIVFPNNVIYKFAGYIELETESLCVKLPILKDVIKIPINVTCYLEVQDKEDKLYKIQTEPISFQLTPSVELKIDDKEVPLNATCLSKNEISLDPKSTVLKKINYKRNS
jgi:hypothetical protein